MAAEWHQYSSHAPMSGVLNQYWKQHCLNKLCIAHMQWIAPKNLSGLQAKPFISEAHVFNDAGLSFDVWPPKTGSFSVPTSTYEPGAADGSDSNVDGIVIETSGKLPLVVDSCSADITSDAGTSSVSPHNISMGSGNDGGGSTDMSRGYLLAVKLWQEAVTTVAAASRNAAHGQK